MGQIIRIPASQRRLAVEALRAGARISAEDAESDRIGVLVELLPDAISIAGISRREIVETRIPAPQATVAERRILALDVETAREIAKLATSAFEIGFDFDDLEVVLTSSDLEESIVRRGAEPHCLAREGASRVWSGAIIPLVLDDERDADRLAFSSLGFAKRLGALDALAKAAGDRVEIMPARRMRSARSEGTGRVVGMIGDRVRFTLAAEERQRSDELSSALSWRSWWA